ncbi:MAG: hypothetical protein ABJN95_12255 [Maribacter sp.]|uniref:hypothetical protein n=1 Tax=Maribacter sp. TaxID=1897614 RepID=UPI00329A244D
MSKKLNKTIAKIRMLFILAFTTTYAQDVTTIDAASEDISNNLDLEAVASIFGDSKDLEEFEYKLNDPDTQISNLDLNEDGNVDYLRVVETAENDTHLIALQAVLGEDIYQDVATIEVEKDNEGNTRVQVVGDVYLYGNNFIVEPVYVHRPIIFSWFWRPFYRPYRSIFYWGYYPKHYRFWKPFHVGHYKKNVHVHVNVKHTFHYTKVRFSTRAVHLHTKVKRNDYAVRHPHKAHSVRLTAVNKSNGTKKRAVAVNKNNGDKVRVAGVNQADGDKYRSAGVKTADGSTKRVAGVNKADGTKKRAATKKNTDGSRKSVAVKKNPDGSKRAVAVKKDANGNSTVKAAGKTSSSKKKGKTQAKSAKKKVAKRKKK